MKIAQLLLSLIFFYFSYDIYLKGKFIPYYIVEVDLGSFKNIVSLIFFSIGVFYFLQIFKRNNESSNKKKNIEFSKCPKCKTSYNYSDLKDGVCPKCNIKTVEIEKYYKEHPEELEDV